jgi:hypothetical protein
MSSNDNSDNMMEDSYGSNNQDESASESSHRPQYNYEYTDDGDNTKHVNIERIHQLENAMSNVRRVVNKYGNAPLPPLDPNVIDEKGWEIDSNSPWADVPAAMKEIVAAREQMHKALQSDVCQESNHDKTQVEWWEPYLSKDTNAARDAEKQVPQQDHSTSLSTEEQKQFEQVHMEWATNAFAEELEALRNGTLEQQFGVKKKKVDALDLDQNELSFVVSQQKSSNTSRNNDHREDVDVQVLADMIRSGGAVFSDVEKRMLLRARQRGDVQNSDDYRENSLSIHEVRRRKLGFLR